MLTIMGMKARDLAVDLRNTRIEIQKLMKPDPRRIGGIHLTFHFPDSLQVTEKQRLILERAGNTCPVRYSIHPDIEVLIHYNWPTIIASR
jgi:uncharacterized OsmC-like protein